MSGTTNRTIVSNESTSDLDSSAAGGRDDGNRRRWIDQDELRHRPSHWHDPSPPKNLKYGVMLAGKVLLVVGALLVGFVVYQSWGTGIEAARAQDGLQNEFEDVTAATSDVPETTAPPTSVPPPETTTAPEEDAAVLTTSSAPPSTAPPVQSIMIPEVARGEVLAKLEIPRIGKTGDSALFVVPGVSRDDLKNGPGHFPGTPLPGQLGNASIAGHRTTYGEPFRNLDQLEEGDEVIVTVTTGQRFVYDVVSQQVVEPDDLWVVSTQTPDVALLTLTSCDPVGSAEFRLAIHAVLDVEQSDPVGPPTLYDLPDGAAAPVAGPTPMPMPVTVPTDADAAEPSPAAEPAAAPTTAAVAATAADPIEDAEPTSPEPSADPVVQPEADAFGVGWFADRGAFPQIAIWAGALLVIVFLGYQVARQTRRSLLGVAFGVVPLLVALYFFYQNVSRLLPPGF
ncbi:sortase [Ilumatobacter nonamiensis]|uniref:sortase n=1 Tax=Ilumatobacter nonamiensis TaxID=467093 RepID=UPI000349F42F|nr:sortase [Ilumatobacter nonamiensis]